jgi:NNP family nitrate/nitrite transporter-like MFS transporter
MEFMMSPWIFTTLLVILGMGMGVGKAAVYKHIPEYFPNDVGAVGGLVGLLGALGGFFLPLLFAYCYEWTGLPQVTFFLLFLLVGASFLWMHVTIVRMLRKASPELRNTFEVPHSSLS